MYNYNSMCEFLYTRFLTFMLISTMVFYVVKNNGM